MPWWLAAVATVGLVFAAAKAHGRQIRLEREQQGFFHVDFRKQNPPAVEAIWRADRRVFWPTFAALAFLWVAIAGIAWVTIRFPLDPALLVLELAWAFAGAFVTAGLVSWVRLAGRGGGGSAWHRAAYRGSLAWWGLVAVAAALVAVAFQV